MFDTLTFQERVSIKLPVVPTGRNGFHIHLPNGYIVSVQWGAGTYSDNHTLSERKGWENWGKEFLRSATAEVAVFNPKGDIVETPFNDGDTVIGWQREDDVQKIIQWAKKLPRSNVCAHCGMPNDPANFECNKCGAPVNK